MRRKILAMLTIILLIGLCTTRISNENCRVVKATGDSPKNLLMIIEDDSIYDESFINSNSRVTYDIVEVSDLFSIELSDYDEIAAPYLNNTVMNQFLSEQYNVGKKVYIYGELTIDDFCEKLNIQEYAVDIVINNIDEGGNISEESATMTYDTIYAAEEVHNVIALKKNSTDGLLATIPKETNGEYNLNLLMKAVYDDVAGNITLYNYSRIKSGYNVKTYTTTGHYAILDWYLYKCNEQDSDYDYYGVEAHIGVEGGAYNNFTYLGEGIYANMECAFASDELVDSGPGSSTTKTDFNVGLNFGDSGATNLGWSFLIDNEPRITRTVSLSSDTVEWEVEEKDYTLDGEVFEPGMTWATKTSTAALDIDFRGYFESTHMGLFTYTDWKTVSIRVTP